MIASMYKSVEGTLANMDNMSKQYWSNIAPILGAIGTSVEGQNFEIAQNFFLVPN